MMVSIIIVNYNTSGLLGECLASVIAFTKNVECEIIVVDNASGDDSVAMVKKRFPQVRLVVNSENVGFSRANNAGAHGANGSFLLFLNSDTLFHEDTVGILSDALAAQPRIGAIGPRLVFGDGLVQPSFGRYPTIATEFSAKLKHHLFTRWRRAFSPLMDRRNRRSRSVEWITGACLMVRREVFDSVGGFDETMFMYFEDVDLCKRIHDAGWDIIFHPATTLTHLLGRSMKSVRSDIMNDIYRRSQLLYYKKHNSRMQLLLLQWYLRITGRLPRG